MIREATADDLSALLDLRTKLWPHRVGEENSKEMVHILKSAHHAAMLAFRDDGTPCGYLELCCKSAPFGYIEGIYIDEADRGKGIGRMMIESGLRWLELRGCTEVGSNAHIDNQVSIDFHKKLGFEEVDRHVVFKRAIKPNESARFP
jgi:aminoglycoside 6'-N-acetyltransferase I